MSLENLNGMQKATIGKAKTATGTKSCYFHSTFALQDGLCICLFGPASDQDVRRLNDDAGLPYDQ
jgi:hypothetical protein